MSERTVNLQETNFHKFSLDTQYGKISLGFTVDDETPCIYFKNSGQSSSFIEGRVEIPELDIYSDAEVQNLHEQLENPYKLFAVNDGPHLQQMIIEHLEQFYTLKFSDELAVLATEG